MACVWSVEKWEKFLLGKRFVLYTDHQALVALLQSFGTGHKPLRISRWAALLLRFNFEVKYRPGKYNVVADALSRVPIPSCTDNFSVEDKAAICAILVGPLVPAVAPEELAAETLADPILCRVLDRALLPYFKLRNELFVYNTSCLGRGQCSVIPASLQKRVLLLAHESHAGVVRTKQRLREVAWWPGIDEEVEDFVQSCTACKLSDKSGQTFSMPLQPVQFPDAAWKKLSIDIMGPIENAPPEFRYMVVLTDYYSKWIEISGATRVTTTVVVKIMNLYYMGISGRKSYR